MQTRSGYTLQSIGSSPGPRHRGLLFWIHVWGWLKSRFLLIAKLPEMHFLKEARLVGVLSGGWECDDSDGRWQANTGWKPSKGYNRWIQNSDSQLFWRVFNHHRTECAALSKAKKLLECFSLFGFFFSTPHREEALQLSCVYGASQEYQLVSMADRRIICSSGSRPSWEFSNIERYQQQ